MKNIITLWKQLQNLTICKNRSRIDTPNTHVHDHPFSWLGTDTSMKSGGVKQIFYELKSPHLVKSCGHASVM